MQISSAATTVPAKITASRDVDPLMIATVSAFWDSIDRSMVPPLIIQKVKISLKYGEDVTIGLIAAAQLRTGVTPCPPMKGWNSMSVFTLASHPAKTLTS